MLGFGGGLGFVCFDYFWMDCRGCMRTLDKLVVVCFVVVNLLWGVWFGWVCVLTWFGGWCFAVVAVIVSCRFGL